jgi:hypothetical protein
MKHIIAGIKMTEKPTYVSTETFPSIQWGHVAGQCRNFTEVDQTMVIIAHSEKTIRQAANKLGFGVTVKATKIPYNFEVTSTSKLTVGVKVSTTKTTTETFKLRAVA